MTSNIEDEEFGVRFSAELFDECVREAEPVSQFRQILCWYLRIGDVRFEDGILLWEPILIDSHDSSPVVMSASKKRELEVERHCHIKRPASWSLACKERGSTRFLTAGKGFSLDISKDSMALGEERCVTCLRGCAAGASARWRLLVHRSTRLRCSNIAKMQCSENIWKHVQSESLKFVSLPFIFPNALE